MYVYLHAYTCYQSELWHWCRHSQCLRTNEELKQLYLLDKVIAGEQLHPLPAAASPLFQCLLHVSTRLQRQERKLFPRKSPAVPPLATRRWAPCHPGKEAVSECSSPRSASCLDRWLHQQELDSLLLKWNGHNHLAGKGRDFPTSKSDPVC